MAGARRITPTDPERVGERDELPRRELLGARVGGQPHRDQRLAGAARAIPGRACSSERASDLRRWANASRTSAATPGAGAGPVRRSPISAESTRGRGVNTARSTLRSIRTSQASCTITLGEP